MFWKFSWFELNVLCMKEDQEDVSKRNLNSVQVFIEDRDMGKRRRLKEMKKNIANAKEAGFSIEKILGEATEEPTKK